jgi:hypothetical protein
VCGFRVDWPEYPPYDLRSCLFDFNPQAHAALRAQGAEPVAYGRLVSQHLSRWQAAARDAAPRGHAAVSDALAQAGWDGFFSDGGDGAPLWASKRASVGALLRSYRAALDAVDGPRRLLEPQIFPAPLSRFSGVDWQAISETADAVGIKLYTMHWPMIARYWARDLIGSSDGPQADAVTAAMAGFMDFCDGAVPDGSVLQYPPPTVAHPVGAGAQARKIAQAHADAAKIPVIAFAHSYGPTADVLARVHIAALANRQQGDTRLWINRYGYLSDDKLTQLSQLGQGLETVG